MLVTTVTFVIRNAFFNSPLRLKGSGGCIIFLFWNYVHFEGLKVNENYGSVLLKKKDLMFIYLQQQSLSMSSALCLIV
jgi:hypothetical protein